jgi:hypothetical protein
LADSQRAREVDFALEVLHLVVERGDVEAASSELLLRAYLEAVLRFLIEGAGRNTGIGIFFEKDY